MDTAGPIGSRGRAGRPGRRRVGILRGFEQRIERAVEGFFARALPGGGVQPVELGKRMVRAMEENKTVSVGSTYAPNSFTFYLSKKDHARLASVESALVRELDAVCRRAAASEGWKLLGPPAVRLEADLSVASGTFDVKADIVESDEPQPEAGPQTALIQMSLEADAELVLVGKNARRWPLSKDEIVIGRLEGCDVIVEDPSLSRRHAEIRREGDEWVLIDLGSTNGTEVNGKRVNRHRLAPGDRLTFGETTFEFRRP